MGNVQGGVLVNVQEWGCFSNFLRADDVTRQWPRVGVFFKFFSGRMTSRRQCPSGGGGGACECPRVGVFFKFFLGRMTSRGQCPRGGALVKNPVSAPGPPPPPLSKILDPPLTI